MTDQDPARPRRASKLIPEELDEEQRALYALIVDGPRATNSPFALLDDEGSLEGPFNAMLLSPAVGTPLQQLGAAIRYQSILTDREREIAILAVAVERRCEFEWYAHRLIAERIGMTGEELAALSDGEPPATATQSEHVVHLAARQMVRTRTLDDDLFDRAQQQLGTQKLAELVTLVGYYDHLALSLAVWQTPLPQGVEAQFR